MTFLLTLFSAVGIAGMFLFMGVANTVLPSSTIPFEDISKGYLNSQQLYDNEFVINEQVITMAFLVGAKTENTLNFSISDFQNSKKNEHYFNEWDFMLVNSKYKINKDGLGGMFLPVIGPSYSFLIPYFTKQIKNERVDSSLLGVKGGEQECKELWDSIRDFFSSLYGGFSGSGFLW